MAAKRNILWIMCDQLRFDYLSCYGHPHLQTPHIDALAARGVRFSRAYVQSPICGPSRMSFYTGRYMRSHGANWNNYPLRVDEPTLGDALKPLGVRCVLVGKTHMRADAEGMARLGIDPASPLGVHVAQCGFEPYERDDGLHPDPLPRPRYDAYLREHGFAAANPWEHWANSAEAPDGSLRNGWLMANVDQPARVPEEHSETTYMTRRAMAFIDEAASDARPWCLHLSYIKPHWPYIAPAPYHAMYSATDVLPAVRTEEERAHPHPVYGAFMQTRASRAFSREEVRQRVIPAYMGLIKQIDDQIGTLARFLAERDLSESTMVVFTSDHGDYLGDHWLGDKDLFHDCSARIPLIVADPSADADATRGSVCDALVEAIDLVPSFVSWFGGTPQPNVIEGRSLLPLLRGESPPAWRSCVFSEYDYAMMPVRRALGTPIDGSRLFMVFDGRWKYIHATGFRPMLYDLHDDPAELRDRGADPACAEERARLKEALLEWALRDHNRITMPDARIAAYGEAAQLRSGILIGYWDEDELLRARADFGLG
ncbi:MAG: alkaline phosphatase family protein [Alphaproteobacteria bacterium]|nr:alkaline phosphatase family protein [Alphaproteobacteria bacterium]